VKRYINGKLYEITKEEHEAQKNLFKGFTRKTKASDSEQRIKDLEDTIKELSEKLAELQK
jgi:hypothetical protein